MADAPHDPGTWTFHRMAPERWADFEQLFGPSGAVGGCWCMWWRLTSSEFDRQKGEGNRAAFRAMVEAGEPTGVLAYDGDTAVGWCSFAPRDRYPRLDRSRTLRRVDDTPVWSIGCFFIARDYRGRGLSAALLRAAVVAIEELGGRVVEAYPLDPADDMPAASAWTGSAPVFRAAGFVEVERRSAKRPIVRYTIP